MLDEKIPPRDSKIISIILRSLGITECEPKVITQLLEYSYKYTNEVVRDAEDYSRLCGRNIILSKDIKLALHTRLSQKSLPPPSRKLLQPIADSINKGPLTAVDSENLLRAPNVKSGYYGIEYDADEDENFQQQKLTNTDY